MKVTVLLILLQHRGDIILYNFRTFMYNLIYLVDNTDNPEVQITWESHAEIALVNCNYLVVT